MMFEISTPTSFGVPSIVKVVVRFNRSGKIFSSIVFVISVILELLNEIVSSKMISSCSDSSKPFSKTLILKFSKVGIATVTAMSASTSKLILYSSKMLSISGILLISNLKLSCSMLK